MITDLTADTKIITNIVFISDFIWLTVAVTEVLRKINGIS